MLHSSFRLRLCSLLAVIVAAQLGMAGAQTGTFLSAPSGATKTAKIPPQQLLEKLLACGAAIWIKRGPTGDMVPVKTFTDAVGPEYTFARVEFPAERPDEKPLTMDDYALLDSLNDLPELAMTGETVTDAVLEKLRPFRALHNLALDGAKLTAASYSLLASLPELHDLQLRNTGTSDDAMKMVAQCRKLQNLLLGGLPLTDAGLAVLPQFPALEDLELADLQTITVAGFTHFAECRVLRTFYAEGFTIYSGMVERLGQCKKLESVALPDSVLKDADIAPLNGLSKLRALVLNDSRVTGAAFATWLAHTQFTSLNLENAGLLDDAGCKSIEHAFPKLEDLNIKLADSGFTTAGASVLRRLTSLHTLRLGGAGVTDEIVTELAHCDGLNTLAIPMAQLSEKGIGALAHVPHLGELTLNAPPISDAALKFFSRCKELKTVNIAKDAPAGTEDKLRGALPKLTVNRAEQ